MKKHGILNREINVILGKLGHTDQIVIADAGLPIPDNVKCIDLSLRLGEPSFNEVLALICEEMIIEKAYVSKDICDKNPTEEKAIKTQLNEIEIVYIDHKNFKEQTKEAKVIIRTGEDNPFANIILQAGCLF